MSDKPDKKAEAPVAAAGDGHDKKPAKAGLLTKTPVLMGIMMLLEAVVLIGGFKFLAGGPKEVAGAETTEEHAPAAGGAEGGHGGGHGDGKEGGGKSKEKKKSIELPVMEGRFPNKISGRTLLFDVSLSVKVKGDLEESLKNKIADNKGLISDRVRTIIAQSDPEKLSGGLEPGLETLRRQVKYQLDDVLGEGLVDEVLFPRWIPFRGDF